MASLQRLALHSFLPSEALAARYFDWLHRASPLVCVARPAPDRIDLRLLGLPVVRLEGTGATFEVVGGWLARGGRFTFEVEGTVARISLDGFRSPLPDWLYRATHGRVHEAVMQAFVRSVEREAPESVRSS